MVKVKELVYKIKGVFMPVTIPECPLFSFKIFVKPIWSGAFIAMFADDNIFCYSFFPLLVNMATTILFLLLYIMNPAGHKG